MREMDDVIKDYVTTLQSIVDYKTFSDDTRTPYTLEMQRQQLHNELFQDHILIFLDFDDQYEFTEHDAYLRSKEIFANLDKVYRIYDMSPFDIADDHCVRDLCKYLKKFLLTTETIYFLNGKTDYIHGIHI